MPVRLPFFYGWIVVAVAFVTMGVGVNVRTAFSLLYPSILAEFGWERGTTALAFSLGFVAATVGAPLVGVLMDRHGPRLVIPLGVGLVVAGQALAPLVSRPWHLHATLGVLVGGGSIFMSYMGHSFFLPNWFARRRGLAIGIAFSGVGVGSVALFPWLQRIIDAGGWRPACWTLAVLTAALLPLNLLLQRGRPEELGLRPDGDPTPSAAAAGTRPADNVVDHAWAATDWTLARAARTAPFWWIQLGFFGALFAWYLVQVHQTKYLIDVGFSRDVAAYALGFVPLAGIVGQIALGHLSDRLGREWAWTFSMLGYVVCYAALLALPARPSLALVYAMALAQGVLGYGVAAIFGAIPAEIFQGRQFATIFGVLNVSSSLGSAAGPWVAGVVHDQTGSYAPAFWMAIALSFLSMLAIWQAAPRKVRLVAGRVGRLR